LIYVALFLAPVLGFPRSAPDACASVVASIEFDFVITVLGGKPIHYATFSCFITYSNGISCLIGLGRPAHFGAS